MRCKKVLALLLSTSLVASIGTLKTVKAETVSQEYLYANAYKATVTAIKNNTQISINAAREAVKLLPQNLDWARGEFSKQVDKLQQPIFEKAYNAIAAVQKIPSQANINTAKAAIDPDMPEYYRSSYSSAIDTAQQEYMNKAVEAYTKAVQSKLQVDVDAANALFVDIKTSTNPAICNWVDIVQALGDNKDLSDGAAHTGNYAIYSASGTFGSTDSAKPTTIKGNILINNNNGDSITLQNMNIDGVLSINFGAGNIVLNNIKVNGVTVTNIGSNSLHVTGNAVINNLNVQDSNNDARIVIEGNASITNVRVLSGANLEVSSTATNAHPFGIVTIAGTNLTTDNRITLTGVFDVVVISVPNVIVDLQGASVGTVVFTKEAVGAKINMSKEATINTLNINAPITVTGTGSTTTANIGASGTTIEGRPANIAVVAGVTAAVGGQTRNDSNSIVIVGVPEVNVSPVVVNPPVNPPSRGDGGGGGSSIVSVSGISAAPTTINLASIGAKGTITATVSPENATNKNVVWSSSNEAVATVTDGVVTAIGPGTANIKVASVSDSSKTSTIAVNVVLPVKASIKSVAAYNGSIKITLAAKPTIAPAADDFTATAANNGAAPTELALTDFNYDGNVTVTYNFKAIALTEADQSVVIVIKLGEGTKEAPAFMVGKLQATANVKDLGGFKESLANAAIKTINITENFSTAEKIIISRPITINGEGKTINFTGDAAGWQGNYVMEVYDTTEVTISNIKLAGADGALLVNAATVTLTGAIDVSGNEFGGIEVSKGIAAGLSNPSLTVTGVTFTNTTETYGLPTIWEDGVTGTVTGFTGTTNSEVKTNQVQYYITVGNFTAIKNVDELKAAIKNQQDDQTWVVFQGNYGLTPMSDYTAEGQNGWYMPITANNLIIKGVGMPVIYGDEYSKSGIWSSQNLVTVFGNNVKIDGICFMPKIEVNKTIEITGKDFTITNCKFTVNTKTANTGADTSYIKYGGALYFSGDKGTVLVKGNSFSDICIVFDSMAAAHSVIIEENNFEKLPEGYYGIGNTSWSNPPTTNMADVIVRNNKFVSADKDIIIKNRMTGTFELSGNTINGNTPSDWTPYIALQNDKFSTPTNPIVVVDGKNYSIPAAPITEAVVKTAEELKAVLAKPEITTIKLYNDITIIEPIAIERQLTIDGQNYTMEGSRVTVAAPTSPGEDSTIIVKAADVVIKNVTIIGPSAGAILPSDGKAYAYGITAFSNSNNLKLINVTEKGAFSSGINIVGSSNVSLESVVSLDNNEAGIIVNGSTVTVNNVSTSGNVLGGIDVNQGSGITAPPMLTVNGTSNHKEAAAIWIEDIRKAGVSVVDTNNQYFTIDNGNTRIFKLKSQYPIENYTSNVISDFNYGTIDLTQARMVSIKITSSDFSGANRKSFTITDRFGNVIPISLTWNILMNEYTPTYASAVGSAVESEIQQWFFDHKGGANGIMNRTLCAGYDGDNFIIGTFEVGSNAIVKVGGSNASDFFGSTTQVTGTSDTSKNRVITVNDGTKTVSITLNKKFADIAELVGYISNILTGSSVNAKVQQKNANQFEIIGKPGAHIIVTGIDKL